MAWGEGLQHQLLIFSSEIDNDGTFSSLIRTAWAFAFCSLSLAFAFSPSSGVKLFFLAVERNPTIKRTYGAEAETMVAG